MKGKKVFPHKNNSNIFFIDNHTVSSFPKASTHQHISSTTPNIISHRANNSNEHSNIQEQCNRTSYKRRNFSVDNSETKVRNKITSKIKKVEPDIAKFRKKKENVSFLFPEKYYMKFVNKQPNGFNNNNNIKNNVVKNKNVKTLTYEISKTKNDNKVIDMADVKRSFTRNGMNMHKISGCSDGMTHINKDKVMFCLQEDDVKSSKFEQVKKMLLYKGFKITQKSKENYDKEVSVGIFPAKSKWTDGGALSKRDGIIREKMGDMKSKRSNSCEERKECFKKKSTVITKGRPRDLEYKNDIMSKRRKVASTEK